MKILKVKNMESLVLKQIKSVKVGERPSALRKEIISPIQSYQSNAKLASSSSAHSIRQRFMIPSKHTVQADAEFKSVSLEQIMKRSLVEIEDLLEPKRSPSKPSLK